MLLGRHWFVLMDRIGRCRVIGSRSVGRWFVDLGKTECRLGRSKSAWSNS